jgi:hypothetical protein
MRIVSLIMIALGLASCRPNPAENAVRQLARDPESVQFRDVKECPADAELTTGFFNAKNAFGAYVGFQEFVFDGVVAHSSEFGDIERMTAKCYGEQYIDAAPLEKISATE